jgi:hypothetical protein
MKKFFLPAIFVGSIIAGRWFLASLVSPPAELPKYNYLSCMGSIKDYAVTYKASFFLVKRALDENIDQNFLREAAWRMNRYAFANQAKYFPSQAKTIAISNDVIRNISYEDSLYPNTIKIPPSTDVHQSSGSEEAYLERLYQLGEIKKGEPAIRVTYEASQSFYPCHGQGRNFDPSELKFFVPADPYIALNYFPEAEWPEVILPHHRSSGTLNPCFRRDMVNPKKKIKPLTFTFGWMPFDKGRDVDGKEYDCSQYYRVGDNVFQITPSFTEKIPEQIADLNFSRFEDLKRPLRASILFGSLAIQNSTLDPEEAKAYVTKYFSEIPKEEAEKNLPLQNAQIDKSFSRLLVFLRNLRAHVDPRDFTVEASSEMVQIVLRGKLRQSKKDMELFIHYSQNLPERAGYENFENALVSRFLKSDILIYNGHFADGRTLSGSFDQISESLKRSPAQPHVAYQIMGILSCSSHGTHRPETVPLPAGMRRDIVYGTGEYLDASAYGSLSFIVATDKYLYNKRVPKFSQWASYFQSDNSFQLHNQR